jgi:hypothetical protein
MKKIILFAAKTLLVVGLFTSGTIVLSANGFSTVSEAKAAVTEEAVVRYLEENGYTVLSLARVEGSDNWRANTIKNGEYLITTVYVRGDQVITCEDVHL